MTHPDGRGKYILYSPLTQAGRLVHKKPVQYGARASLIQTTSMSLGVHVGVVMIVFLQCQFNKLSYVSSGRHGMIDYCTVKVAITTLGIRSCL